MKKNNLNLSNLIEQYKNTTLINDYESSIKKGHSENISLNLLEMNPLCSKYYFKKEELNSLESTLSDKGIIDPIIVRQRNEKYQVVAGFKRYHLAKRNKLTSVPAIVEDISDEFLLAIIIQRLRTLKDENVLNKAYIYDAILKQYQLDRKELARLLNISISQITNTLRILKLDDTIKKALKEEKITYGHARMLVGLTSDDQVKFLSSIVEEKLSVRDIEKLIYSYKNNKNKTNYEIQKDNFEVIFKFSSLEEANNFYNKYKK